MTDIATLAARIAVLEMDKTHQDRAIEDLHEALTAQWKEIEGLRRELKRLTEEVQDMGPSGPGEPDPPPPHY